MDVVKPLEIFEFRVPGFVAPALSKLCGGIVKRRDVTKPIVRPSNKDLHLSMLTCAMKTMGSEEMSTSILVFLPNSSGK